MFNHGLCNLISNASLNRNSLQLFALSRTTVLLLDYQINVTYQINVKFITVNIMIINDEQVQYVTIMGAS